MTRRLPLARMLPGLLLLMTPMESSAQDRLRIQPFISAAMVHDSDVFSTPADRRDDVITRVSPGVATTYDLPTLTVSGRYTIDVERFVRHAELTRMDARTQGTVALMYRATPRVSVMAGGELLTTRTPRDFTAATGLTIGRAPARRFAANASVKREFSAVTSGALAYTLADERLGRSFSAITRGADVSLKRRLSSRTDVHGAYRVQTFGFTSGASRSRVTSHSVSLGAGRALTPRLRASVDIGPRLTGDVVRPELAASVACACSRVDLTIAYTRTQATVIGVAGVADVQSMAMTIRRTFRRSLEVDLSPGIFRSVLGASQADVYGLAVSVRRPIVASVAVDMSLQGSVQRGNVHPGGAGDVIPRHTILMRLVAGPAARQPQR